jgi:hypothetical protein
MDEISESVETESRAKRLARRIVPFAAGAIALFEVLHMLAPALNNPLQLQGRRALVFWSLVALLAVTTCYRLFRAVRPLPQQH